MVYLKEGGSASGEGSITLINLDDVSRERLSVIDLKHYRIIFKGNSRPMTLILESMGTIQPCLQTLD